MPCYEHFYRMLARMKNDPWLEKWLDLIQKRADGGRVLELGCGSGWDTIDLVSSDYNLIALDISGENLKKCAESAPHAAILNADIGKLLPFANHSVAVILASLSLHYFSWEDTMQVASELRRCIQDGGILLTRFNSTHDFYHGASSVEEIEPNFYLVGTKTKRFFDETSVRHFLQGWDIRFLEENVIQRYRNPKYVWEAMAVCG
jgi:ubiquinone/menaquinone biosynthesis C-methylase UbiE